MDRLTSVDLLNQDLRGEHQAIVHYLTHAWTVIRSFGGAVEAIARDEMRHFKWLSHAIVALGGMPDLSPPDPLPLLSGADALDYDISAEEEAIRQYRDHQKTIDDHRLQVLLERIVVDEEDHRRQFMILREQWQQWPGQAVVEGPQLTQESVHPFQAALKEEYEGILTALLQSFFARPHYDIGLRAEDRAIDLMKHLGWLGEALGAQGIPVTWSLPETHNGHESRGWLQEILNWSEEHMPHLAPLVARAIQHQRLDAQMARLGGWTVGPYPEGGYREWMS